MEFLFFVGFPLITFFLGLFGGYIYGSKTATEALRPAIEELNRRIDNTQTEVESLNQSLNQRINQDLQTLNNYASGLETELDMMKIASKKKSKRGIQKKSGK